MIDSRLPAAVVEKILVPNRIDSAERVPPGFSGAVVYECRSRIGQHWAGQQSDEQHWAGQHWALKAWPLGTRSSRIAEVHRVMNVARDRGCRLVPSVEAAITIAGIHWELSAWMPGAPAGAGASPEFVRRGAIEIKRFHEAVASLGRQYQPAPAAESRLRRRAELDSLLPPMIDGILASSTQRESPLGPAIKRASDRLSRNWAEASRRIGATLSEFETVSLPTQYILRDIHRDHLLFVESDPSGLIDFDAVRVDTPAADLARWVGRFLGSGDKQRDEAIWRAGLAGFASENVLNPLSAASGEQANLLSLAKSLHFATTWISLANWLVWVALEKRSFPSGPERVAQRIDELTRQASLTG